MKRIIYFALLSCVWQSGTTQLTIIPLGTQEPIRWLAKHNDTLLIVSGEANYYTPEHYYFAKTADLGQTIITLPSPTDTTHVMEFFQVVGNDYYVYAPMGREVVLKSRDFGWTWDTINFLDQPWINDFLMIDSTFGFMGGPYGGEFRIANQSDTNWVTGTFSAFGLFNVDVIASASYGDSTMIGYGWNGYTQRTDDKGQTWNWGYGTSWDVGKAQFVNKDTIFSIGRAPSKETMFYHSFDGGQNHGGFQLGENIGIPPKQDGLDFVGTDMHFDSPNHGYIIGYSSSFNEGLIFETSNYGQNWSIYHTGINEDLYSLQKMNDTIYFIGGRKGLLIKWNTNYPLQLLGVSGEEEVTPIRLYPNPASSVVQIELPPLSSGEFALSDLQGKIVMKSEVSSMKIEMGLSGVLPGIYIWRFTGDNGNKESGKLSVLK